MSTKNLIPRGDGEGGIGIPGTSWGSGVFNSGTFNDSLTLGGDGVVSYGNLTGSLIPDTNAAYDLGNAEYKIRHLFLSDNSLHIGGTTISAGDTLGEIQFPSGISVTKDSTFNGDIIAEGRVGIGTDSGSAWMGADGEGFHLGVGKYNDGGGTVSAPNGLTITTDGKLELQDSISISGASISADGDGRILFGNEGLMVGQAEVKPDPTNPTALYFAEAPQVKDSEGNPVTMLTADKLGLGTSAVLENADEDLQFKLLTDQNRFVVGTSGDGGLASGWYRFNDFKVKGATDIGAHPINPVDTRVYSDDSSFVLFKKDSAGNRVAHLVGGNEEVSSNNAIALGIAVKVDQAEYPEDIEFVHTDGGSYSVINGNSDSVGINGLPIRQGFQSPSLGANPSPLLIDGGSF